MKAIAVATANLQRVALAAAAQSTIRGRVVADDTDDPVVNARVSLAPAAPGTPVVLSDADGRFVLPASAGRATVVASKTSYARAELTISSRPDAIELRLRKGAVVSGRVVNEFGDPIASARIAIERAGELPASTAPPARAPLAGATATIAAAETDDRGEYRGRLPAGSFVIAVLTTSATAAAHIVGNQTLYGPSVFKSYYPGSETAKEALALELEAGGQRRGVDFVVAANRSDVGPDGVVRVFGGGPLPQQPAGAPASAVVRGAVTTTDGRPLANAQVRLVVTAGMPMPRTAKSADDGGFEFTGLPAGKYGLMASKSGYGFDMATDLVAVEVGEGQRREHVDVRLRAGARSKGAWSTKRASRCRGRAFSCCRCVMKRDAGVWCQAEPSRGSPTISDAIASSTSVPVSTSSAPPQVSCRRWMYPGTRGPTFRGRRIRATRSSCRWVAQYLRHRRPVAHPHRARGRQDSWRRWPAVDGRQSQANAEPAVDCRHQRAARRTPRRERRLRVPERAAGT